MRHTHPIRLVVVGLSLALGSAVVNADVVAVVSVKSPITALSMAQVADIFIARTSAFPDGRRAIPIDQSEDSAARNEFYEKIAGKSAAQVKAFWSKIIFTGRGQPPSSVSNDIEMKKYIRENPDAIGYLDRSAVDGSIRIIL